MVMKKWKSFTDLVLKLPDTPAPTTETRRRQRSPFTCRSAAFKKDPRMFCVALLTPSLAKCHLQKQNKKAPKIGKFETLSSEPCLFFRTGV